MKRFSWEMYRKWCEYHGRKMGVGRTLLEYFKKVGGELC